MATQTTRTAETTEQKSLTEDRHSIMVGEESLERLAHMKRAYWESNRERLSTRSAICKALTFWLKFRGIDPDTGEKGEVMT